MVERHAKLKKRIKSSKIKAKVGLGKIAKDTMKHLAKKGSKAAYKYVKDKAMKEATKYVKKNATVKQAMGAIKKVMAS